MNIRPGRTEDLPRIFQVRTAVEENHLSLAQLADLGITQSSLAADMAAGHLGCWVGKADGIVVAFSMASASDGQVFGLFVEPGYEGRGFGRTLLRAAADWLRVCGHRTPWLTTGIGTRAEGFYASVGWQADGVQGAERVYRLPPAG